jgi:hypothetical protein
VCNTQQATVDGCLGQARYLVVLVIITQTQLLGPRCKYLKSNPTEIRDQLRNRELGPSWNVTPPFEGVAAQLPPANFEVVWYTYDLAMRQNTMNYELHLLFTIIIKNIKATFKTEVGSR